MAEIVAEAFLSAMFEKLFELLTSREFRNFFQGKKSIDDQLELLNEKLKDASLLLNDAEARQITDQKVKEWLDDLKDVIFRADDLMEEIKAEARSKQRKRESRRRLRKLKEKMSALVNHATRFDRTVESDAGNILKDLNYLLERAKTLRLKHIEGAQIPRSLQRSPAPLLEEKHVHGRDADREKILELLLSGEVWGNKIGVLPIVGMGGLGKTTLARLLYDDDRVKNHGFQLKAWVTVSTEFDIYRMTKIILQQVSPQTTVTEEQAELLARLKEALKGKKFLFVLDDVWEENYASWDSLKSAFMSGDCGSRIIVTTRSQKVVSNVKTGEIKHELPPVSEDDCWRIFVDHAFNGDSEVDQLLQKIGKQIVKKCDGLPLAVRAIGGSLRSDRNPETWESILRSHVWSEKLRNDILPGLWLSYCFLPSHLKQCFAYCSIFPKDHEFEEEETILLWMAQGFLQPDEKDKRMEEVGKEYLDELMARSLIQRSRKNESAFIMHDLVHDLAMFISGKVCFRFDDTTNVEQLTKKTRHISTKGNTSNSNLWKGRFEAKYLRSFIKMETFKYYDDDLNKEVIGGGTFLRVLLLLKINPSMLPDSFIKLKHLRYLNLYQSKIKELPSSLCTLYALETLLLSNCQGLTQLPKDLGRLINLRHLDTRGTPLKEMPPHMGCLEELQTLTDFVLGEHGNCSGIDELGALQNLRGNLRICGLQNVIHVEDVVKAELRSKERLCKLAMEWEGDIADTRREKEVLGLLQPHQNLKQLRVQRYAASSFPNWVGDSMFIEMVSMHLIGNGDFCLELPPLGQLPSLRELVIGSFHGVEKMGAEFYNSSNSSITPFQSLEILKFSDMKNWKDWSFIGGDGKKYGCFPRLKELSFDGCPNLAGSLPSCDTVESLKIWESYKSMESLPLDNFPKLKKLTLQGSESLRKLIMGSSDVIETLVVRKCNKLEFPGSHHYEHVKDLTIFNGCDSMKLLLLDYFPRLEELFLERCQNLESLTFTKETVIALRSLWIEACQNFRSLPEHMHRLLPSLSLLEIRGCPEMELFPEGGLSSSLNRLLIQNCGKLVAQSMQTCLQGLTSLRSLHISNCEDIMLDSFPEGLLSTSLTRFQLRKLPHVKSLNGSAFQNVACLDQLLLEDCDELEVLPREALLPGFLRSLYIKNCPILERRYQRGKGEDWHHISHIPTIYIGGSTFICFPLCGDAPAFVLNLNISFLFKLIRSHLLSISE